MKVHLRKKKLKSGMSSLYIEYYKGHRLTPEGKTKHLRDFEYLELYLTTDPKTDAEIKKNKETLELAEQILTIRKAEVYQGKYDLKNDTKGKVSLLDFYFQKKEERYQSKGNYDNWDAAQKHLEAYCSPTITFDDIDVDFIKGYKKYLDTVAVTQSKKKLSQNTKNTYYNKFKACLNAAFEEGYLKENLIKKVKGFTAGESTREYLTSDELQKLSKTPCPIPLLKRAFLFSSLSGIRWSDINKLKWSEVRDEGTDNSGNFIFRIVFQQKKTEGVEYLYISQQARELLGERKGPHDRVFKGLRYSAHMNLQLLRWCMFAGINKHITFHSARHTNAVLLLENGADIYTVSKRLGHREIRTTEIYAKIIDKKMKEAANLLPKLNLDLL
ncbi:Site-specific recombinase XerD [Arenibacter nanhaiticus]|uniref:Site-specific recombinase XerD n=1 Tax=Arenibacter nanhaiticus TaxID=558155 RepID=A0A1M6MFB2_9FLAO|nr:site-specific integrase [Arenibacter nanhaiticus]SHJ82145.1 Site-specific recombinase XerD [Arenibacter nanhaiticus]